MEKIFDRICSEIGKTRKYSKEDIEKILHFNDIKLEFKIIADESYNYCNALLIVEREEGGKYIQILDTGIDIVVTLYMKAKFCLNNTNNEIACMTKEIEIGKHHIRY